MPMPKPGKRIRYNRRFSDAQKLAIVEAAMQASKIGDYGAQAAVCKQHNITTAHLAIWRRQLWRKGILPERLKLDGRE